MKPIEFPESNRLLKAYESEHEMKDMRVWTDNKMCISCWKATWKERLSFLLFGKVWVYVLSGGTQPPVALSVDRNIFTKVEDQGEPNS